MRSASGASAAASAECTDIHPLRWARAEVLHLAWKHGRYAPPDRKILEGEILPGLAAEPDVRRVLSVGVAWYTARYAAIFGSARFVTIDLDPAKASVPVPANGEHKVGDLRDLEALFPESEPFDVVLMNGVIGFGLNAPEDVDKALRAVAARMRARGTLLLGVNEEKPTHVDPRSVPAHALFEARGFGGWENGRVTVEVPFRERLHTFLFWRRK